MRRKNKKHSLGRNKIIGLILIIVGLFGILGTIFVWHILSYTVPTINAVPSSPDIYHALVYQIGLIFWMIPEFIQSIIFLFIGLIMYDQEATYAILSTLMGEPF